MYFSVYEVVRKYCFYFPKNSCQFSFPRVINHIDVNVFWSYSVKKVIHFSRMISEAHHCPVDFHHIPFFTWKMSAFLNRNFKYWVRLLISISLIIQDMKLQSVEHYYYQVQSKNVQPFQCSCRTLEDWPLKKED